jgi:hypothetical protein
MTTHTHHGSCHCGRVKFEASFDLADGTHKCNCTSCWKRRWWTVKVQPDAFRAVAGADQLTGPKASCAHCGVIPYAHVPKSEWNPAPYVSVNVATLDDIDHAALAAAPVTFYDGLNNNWWNRPAETRHL